MKGVVVIVFAISLSATSALSYGEKDARYVANTENRAVLKYIVCLEGRMSNRPVNADIVTSLSDAEQFCAKLKSKIPEADAVDIKLNIMECGFRPQDADC